MVNSQNQITKVIVWNLLFFPLFFAVGEGIVYLTDDYFAAEDNFYYLGDYSRKDYWAKDPELGWGANPNSVSRSIQRDRITNKVAYDVKYSFDENGLRVTPFRHGPQINGCAAFLGCSYTFGEGLNDEESLPYVYGILKGENFRSFNFGFHGYGPHQALALIESGRLKTQLSSCVDVPITLYLTTARFHVERVVGKVFWEEFGPWYSVENGQLHRRGNFSQRRNSFGGVPVPESLGALLEKSFLLKKFRQIPRAEDELTYLTILDRINTSIKEQLPNAKLKIIFWLTLSSANIDPDIDADRTLVEKIRALGIEVIGIEQIIPDLRENRIKYELPDSHPSAEANRMIAKYLSEHE